jgi:RNA polymerase sigma-70 factor (ECF subfamily)
LKLRPSADTHSFVPPLSTALYPSALESLGEARVTAGRLGDLRELYEEHADFVRRVVIRLGGPRHDIDDLVQDVFLVALRKQAEFEGRSKASTWLYAIAVRIVASARRRSRLRQFLHLDEAPAAAALVERTTPAALFEHRESSALVYRALDGIAEK